MVISMKKEWVSRNKSIIPSEMSIFSHQNLLSLFPSDYGPKNTSHSSWASSEATRINVRISTHNFMLPNNSFNLILTKKSRE